CSLSLTKAVLKLPPATAWATRTQTLTVQGSTDGTTFTTLVNSAGYTFDPATGNTVTINLPATPTRYLRLNVTGNTGWPAAQLSELQLFGA
uniref:discoidin domain-containing protein n=1 Tax=Kitasatospora sp. NRRL B-11411 TaxID=1463822 RepID=UPI0005644776